MNENEIQKRRRKWGANRLKQTPGPSLLALFLSQFRDFLVLILLGATLISGLLGEYIDGITILFIVILNAFLGTLQEFRAERSLRALQKLAAPHAVVWREGTSRAVAAEEIVPGDIVILEPGDKVCADMRILETRGLLVNEAPLTGESVPVNKASFPMEMPPASPGDAHNMLFSGTLVVEGRGRGIVVATGMDTQLGRIAHLIEHAQMAATPLQQKLNRLGKILVAACLGICAMVVVLGIWRGEPVYRMFMAGVSLAVAAIPEGLPAIVTVSLALGVQRMIRRRAIVRRLPSVETLGSATVICSDKTGTLTQNRMVLREVYSGGMFYRREGVNRWHRYQDSSSSREASVNREPSLYLALQIGSWCNNVSWNGSKGRKATPARLLGDPTETALVEAAREAGVKAPVRRVHEIPFSSDRKRMTVVVEDPRRKALVKGAPEVILARCKHILQDGSIKPLDRAARREIEKNLEQMAASALRTLAIAYREVGLKESFSEDKLERELVWGGLVGLEDPPRQEALPAIRLCHQAGIKVVMITGDHRSTAVAIARRLDILKGGTVLTGREVDELSDRQLYDVIDGVQVFARVDPGHKLRIVRAFKKRDHVVAMTGDGVNDAPAVKEADIGIAMGMTGTEVTKEAAALVLEDDNFSTIVAAVEEGRNIYANIRKFIRFLLGCNTGEILTMLLAILAGFPLPLRPIQLLWINLVTDGLPALALGVEPPDRRIMNFPPRRSEQGIFPMGMWLRIVFKGILISSATIAVFALTLYWQGDLLKAQTAAMATLVVTQLLFVFECRSESVPFWTLRPNYYLLAAVSCSFLLMLMVIYNGFFQTLFRTTPLSLDDWFLIALISLGPYLVSWVITAAAGKQQNSKKGRIS